MYKYPMIKNWMYGWGNSEVFIGLAIMGFYPFSTMHYKFGKRVCTVLPGEGGVFTFIEF